MRKNVSYLTAIRHDVSKTAENMHEVSIDLESALYKLRDMTPEQVRSDKKDEHQDLLKQVYELNHTLRKLTTNYNLAVERLQTFF
jgi:hypothetical protein